RPEHDEYVRDGQEPGQQQGVQGAAYAQDDAGGSGERGWCGRGVGGGRRVVLWGWCGPLLGCAGAWGLVVFLVVRGSGGSDPSGRTVVGVSVVGRVVGFRRIGGHG